MRVLVVAALILVASPPQVPDLRVTMVGNAGIVLTDGATSLLVDLPYRSGAYGYMEYDPVDLSPPGRVVSVVTHDHADHFDPDEFVRHSEWEIIGPPSVVGHLPPQRVMEGDSLRVGDFSVVVVRTPHTEDHRSYRIRWQRRVIHVAGDTEDSSALTRGPDVDLLFVTPWLSCAAASSSGLVRAARRVGYHLDPNGNDQICGDVEVLEQGASFTLSPG